MLKFIYIGDQILEDEKQFSFYDTVTDRFIDFDGQVFDSWGDFLFFREGYEHKYPQHPLERFKGVTPDEILAMHTLDRAKGETK